ncbi:MAG: hypothetical protein WDO16_06780 [Bacteroidota bacterium]
MTEFHSIKKYFIDRSQERMLAELADTIIPQTKNFTGAKSLKAHELY